MSDDLDALCALIVAHDPSLVGATFRLADGGWDSTAVLVDDLWVFRFPNHANAEAALAREARLLGTVRPAVSLAVPDLALVERPRRFSRHAMIPGGHLLPSDYARLAEPERARLAEDLGRFLADLHALPLPAMRQAGAGPVLPLVPPEGVERRALPLLPRPVRARAEAALAAWAGLGSDPHGAVFGHFDLHGWNVAFDHGAGRLGGVFDFGVAGVGPPHREFVQTSQVSPEFTERLVRAYERASGRAIDRERVAVLTAAHRLGELAFHAEDGPDKAGPMLALVHEWFGEGGGPRVRP